MKTIQNPSRAAWAALLERPSIDATSLKETVSGLLGEVRKRGDAAVRELGQKFDRISVNDFLVSETEMEQAVNSLSPDLANAITCAADNIRRFHQQQLRNEEPIETMAGVRCWRKSIGIEKVGLYIPGGTAPLFSTVLMLGIPAKIAGCREVVLCTPPDHTGNVHPAILFAARLTGIHRVYRIGGVQAIAAMAYGTETVPRVFKIFGPGNQYVTCAKQLVQQEGIAIDMPAGPSEVCVLADATASPAFIAADLLSQAEHGADSQVLLVSTDGALIEKTKTELQRQLALLPRKDIAQKALENSQAILLNTLEEAIELVNDYAAEHLIIACADDEAIAGKITNAGSVFLGHYSPESAGDYASGTNHTLPTNGFARAYSGVSVDSFVKKITYQRLTEEGLQLLGNTVISMAEAEGLDAHANAVKIRLKQ
ncbi:histidinol dehydrogenase [Sediminibacterium soli]|uniref:histidinol dehydrogenase n=1 Tax=Sediminibacterium soli TaxID=2698829 RepID=UPI00137A41CC|nr:histidinol dehydrogenase [Sediminibacterium soli]NCI46971.1 histidinol dehydrogenase [Sediminibacterium soli]